MSNLKRDNWTNEEVIKLLASQRISSRGGEITEYCESWNTAIDSAQEMFSDFQRETGDYAAMAYCPENDMIYHIGPILPA